MQDMDSVVLCKILELIVHKNVVSINRLFLGINLYGDDLVPGEVSQLSGATVLDNRSMHSR